MISALCCSLLFVTSKATAQNPCSPSPAQQRKYTCPEGKECQRLTYVRGAIHSVCDSKPDQRLNTLKAKLAKLKQRLKNIKARYRAICSKPVKPVRQCENINRNMTEFTKRLLDAILEVVGYVTAYQCECDLSSELTDGEGCAGDESARYCNRITDAPDVAPALAALADPSVPVETKAEIASRFLQRILDMRKKRCQDLKNEAMRLTAICYPTPTPKPTDVPTEVPTEEPTNTPLPPPPTITPTPTRTTAPVPTIPPTLPPFPTMTMPPVASITMTPAIAPTVFGTPPPIMTTCVGLPGCPT